jgi:hypothetical protein
MIIQLNPTIPVYIPDLGTGQAIGWIDYSTEHHLMWIVALDSTGEIWTLDNTKVRAQKNITMGRII